MAFPFTTSNAFYPNAATFLPANPIPGPQYSAPSSPTSESTALSQDQTPPRPQNKWLIFRNAMMKRLPPREHGRAYTQGEISSILSKKWAARSAEEDAYYTAEAERADAEHKLKYPGYKYKRAAKKEKGGKVKEGSYGVQKRSKGAPRRRTSSPRSQGSRSASGSRAPSPPTSGTSTPNAPQQDNAVAGPSRIPGSLALVDMPPQPVLQDYFFDLPITPEPATQHVEDERAAEWTEIDDLINALPTLRQADFERRWREAEEIERQRSERARRDVPPYPVLELPVYMRAHL